MKTSLALPLSFCLALGAIPLPAQEPPPVAAPLLRRLAEVADAYRTGKPVYIVASTTAPYDVRAVFFDPKTAGDSAGGAYHVFGPYVTPPDRPAGTSEVLSITVKIQRERDTVSVTVNPKEYDALFWTAPAIDKFLVPYYSRVYGPARAAQLHYQYVRSAVIIWGHMVRTIADSLPLPRY